MGRASLLTEEAFWYDISGEPKGCLMKSPTTEKENRGCDAEADVRVPLYRHYLEVLPKPDDVLQDVGLQGKRFRLL